MSDQLPDPSPPGKGQFLVYEAEDGRIKIDVRLADETVWLAQQRAESEYEQYHRRQIEEQARVGSDFDRMAKQLTNGRKKS